MPKFIRSINSQDGNISVVACAFLYLSIILCMAAFDIGLYFNARVKAQNAADAAAITAVQESFFLFKTGKDPVNAASCRSGQNGAKLENITVSNSGEKAEVSVSLETRCIFLREIIPSKVFARSSAEVDIEALLASGAIWLDDGNPVNAVLSRIKINGSQAATTVVLLSLQQLGKPYVWGATGPGSFDCSGLICFVYRQIGIALPRVTFSQVTRGRSVSVTELQPGDLVFFRNNAHVGMYVGSGWYIHAPRSRDVVKLSQLSKRNDISCCRRVL